MTYPEINTKTKEYWDKGDFEKLEMVQSFSEMYVVAQNIVSKMPQTMGQVCGPITTGGLGSKEKNLLVLSQAISHLQDQGKVIFDQMPFEKKIHDLFENKSLGQQHADILNDFYLPLFSSGRIDKLYFVAGWESSKGAVWEHEKAKEFGLEIMYL